MKLPNNQTSFFRKKYFRSFLIELPIYITWYAWYGWKCSPCSFYLLSMGRAPVRNPNWAEEFSPEIIQRTWAKRGVLLPCGCCWRHCFSWCLGRNISKCIEMRMWAYQRTLRDYSTTTASKRGSPSKWSSPGSGFSHWGPLSLFWLACGQSCKYIYGIRMFGAHDNLLEIPWVCMVLLWFFHEFEACLYAKNLSFIF